MSTAKIFISYSHQDREWLERLRIHLKPLQRQGILDPWDDSRIRAGEHWLAEIRQALADARVAVLLISADFLASDFIASEELPVLLAAERSRGLPILGMVLKPCRLAGNPLADIQLVRPPDRPLIELGEAEQESAWVELAEELERYLEEDPRPVPTPDERARRAHGPPTATAPSARATLPAAVWNVPFEQNPFFTGRDEILATLRKDLQATARAALCGLGGIGKTQVAVEYAYRFRTSYHNVFWASADSESDLFHSFIEIARLLDLPEAQDADQTRAVDATRCWLESHQGWLLIFDNADHPNVLKSFRPLNREGHLLITSRNPAMDMLGISVTVGLEKMSPSEAVAFLQQRTGRRGGQDREDQAVAELVRELGYLPLALEQAAAYISANQSRFQDYLRGYRNRRLAVLPAPVAGEYPDSVATTWALNFREVAQVPEAAELLRFSAFLSADNIPLELIARGAPELGPTLAKSLADVLDDPLLLDEALEPLYRYSLIRRDVALRNYSIHPIVQTVLLDGLSKDVQREWAVRAVRAVNKVFPVPEHANWEACGRLLPHALACAALIEKWGFEIPAAGFLLLDTGVYLRRRARYSESAELLSQLLSLRERSLGPNHTAVAETLSSLANLHRHQGHYEKAEPLILRALAITEQAFGAEAPKVAEVLDTLSALYRNMSRLEEAEDLGRRSLEIREKALGADHPALARSLTNLANALRGRGQYPEAEKLLRRSVELEEAAIGAEHPDLAASLTVLADVLRLEGRFSEAEPILKRALALDESGRGGDHPGVAWSLLGLAELYVEQGRLPEAETYFKRALRIRERAFGAAHPLVGETRRRYARLLIKMNRREEATALVDQA